MEQWTKFLCIFLAITAVRHWLRRWPVFPPLGRR